MQIIADLHTHTNVTDHAFSTLTEMVQDVYKRQPRRCASSAPARRMYTFV